MKHLLMCLRLAIRRPHVAFRGVREFRSAWTTHYDEPQINSYDAGRELAHLATFRRYDDTSC